MNKRRLGILARWLEAGAPHKGGVDKFNMNNWKVVSKRETTCCIGGAVQTWWGMHCPIERYEAVGKILDIGACAAGKLCRPETLTNWHKISPQWAARTVRHLMATGNVDWEYTKHRRIA